MPALKKAKRVVGRNLYLRDVTESDAQFVFELRTDPIKSKHLSATIGQVEDQLRWIRNYMSSKDQAYFIVCDNTHSPIGCVRMYEPIDESYIWGSWIMINGLSPLNSVEVSLLVYAYGFHLGFTDVRIEVRQSNVQVWKFHENFAGAELLRENEMDRFYILRLEKVVAMLGKYASFLTTPLIIEW